MLTVAHSSCERLARLTAARISAFVGGFGRLWCRAGLAVAAVCPSATSSTIVSAALRTNKETIATVTDPWHHRSEGVIETVAAPALSSSESAWQRFEALYRSSRADVYAYVATLLRDDAAAEDVTALAFERAYRHRRTFDRRRG